MSNERGVSILQKARLLWARIPFKAVVLIAIFLQLTEEWFPFTHFPMYASLGPSSDYLFVTDGHDQPIALRDTFRVLTSEVKKMLKTRLRAAAAGTVPTAEQEKIAGEETLNYLLKRKVSREQAMRALGGLKLYRVKIQRVGNRLETSPKLIAAVPGASPSP